MSIPASCPQSAQALATEQCGQCGIVNWAAAPDGEPERCRVFLPAADAWITFPAHSCQTPECKERLLADSCEYGLLRYSRGLAFGHELLYQYTRQLKDHPST
jgi:hypothetical protein